MDESILSEWCAVAKAENSWFTDQTIRDAIDGIIYMLEENNLRQWASHYQETRNPKIVAIIMAGNLPLVGFHDLLCSYIIGHSTLIKLSSKDSKLFPLLIREIKKIDSQANIEIADGKLINFDAVIATGSDNSARYFNFYFSKYPNIIRKNRTSAAVLIGNETKPELELLGNDVFQYFGLGCRNVSTLLVPDNFNFIQLLDAWQPFSFVGHHNKYINNYEYQKAIKLVNSEAHLDNGFVLLSENEKLVSPISVVHYQYYHNDNDLESRLKQHEHKLQCVVGNHRLCNVAFGKSQSPSISDFADNIDTMKFLEKI